MKRNPDTRILYAKVEYVQGSGPWGIQVSMPHAYLMYQKEFLELMRTHFPENEVRLIAPADFPQPGKGKNRIALRQSRLRRKK